MKNARKAEDPGAVPYGFRRVKAQEKRKLVLEHFNRIAGRYDLADGMLSFGLHFRWRRFVIGSLGLRPDSRLLDLCGGTGEFAAMAARIVSAEGTAIVCDVNRPMMEAGWKKVARVPWGKRIRWVQGDAEELGFVDRSFDALTVGFGIRNLVDLEKGLREMLRVLKDRGKLVILEFSLPVSPWLCRLYDWYSFKIMPIFGQLVTGRSEPFVYLAESIRTFPSPEKVTDRLRTAGFKKVGFKMLTGGLVTVYFGER